MSTPHLEENLSAYLAGELGSAEKQSAERHLNECPECRDELESLRKLDAMLSHAGLIEPSAGFVSGVMNRIEQDRKVISFRSRRTLAWLAIAAAVAFFAFFVGIRQWHQQGGMASHPKLKKHETEKQNLPPVQPQQPVLTQPQQTPVVAPVQPQPQQLDPEEAELIANLDILENMDVIENYDSMENLDVALLGATEESAR